LPAYQTVWFVESRRGEDACTEPPANKSTEKIVVDPNASLLSYQLHPEGLTGKALFAHQCRMRSRRMEPPKSVYNWGLGWLDVEVQQEQYTILQPTASDLTVGAMMRECGASSASRRMPKRKLNALGEVNAYSVLANDPDRIKRLKSVGTLASTIEKMNENTRGQENDKRALKDKDLKDSHLSSGLLSLAGSVTKGGLTHDGVMKLTAKQMEAILLYRLETRPKVMRKSELADLLMKKAADLNWEVPQAPEEPAVTAEQPAVTVPPESPALPQPNGAGPATHVTDES